MARISCAFSKNGWLPLFDFAYQGLANGLDQDAYGLRAFAANHKELLVASSFSKTLVYTMSA